MENGDRPATKKDLEELRIASKQDLIDMETRILKAFYGYARTSDKNMRQLGLTYLGVSDHPPSAT